MGRQVKVVRLVITDGRQAFLDQMLSSFDKQFTGQIDQTIVVADPVTPEFEEWLYARIPDAMFCLSPTRQGLAHAIRTGWSVLENPDLVIHLEDDLFFTRPISLEEWAVPLTANPLLAQVCLQRGPNNEEEHAAGGILNWYSDTGHLAGERESDGVQWVEQTKLFSLQPNLYPGWLAAIGWPEHGGETEFTEKVLAYSPNLRFAYLDGVGAEPRYEHVGYMHRSPGWFV